MRLSFPSVPFSLLLFASFSISSLTPLFHLSPGSPLLPCHPSVGFHIISSPLSLSLSLFLIRPSCSRASLIHHFSHILFFLPSPSTRGWIHKSVFFFMFWWFSCFALGFSGNTWDLQSVQFRRQSQHRGAVRLFILSDHKTLIYWPLSAAVSSMRGRNIAVLYSSKIWNSFSR